MNMYKVKDPCGGEQLCINHVRCKKKKEKELI